MPTVVSQLSPRGGLAYSLRTVTTSTTLAANDGVVEINSTAAGVTITLPDATTHAGVQFTIAWVAGANAVTLAAQSGQTVDGVASDVIDTVGDTLVVYSNGTAWRLA